MFAVIGGFSLFKCGLGQFFQRGGLIPAGGLSCVQIVQGALHLSGGHQQDISGLGGAVYDGAGGIDSVKIRVGQGAQQGIGVALDSLDRRGDLHQLLSGNAIGFVAVAHVRRSGRGRMGSLPVMLLDQQAGAGDGLCGQGFNGGLQSRTGVELHLLVVITHFLFLPADSFLRVMSLYS